MPLVAPDRRSPGLLPILAGVFLAALLLRLVYIRQLLASGLWDFLRLDPLYYHDWALRIARGDLMGTGTFEMTPLYAYTLGGLFALTGHSLMAARAAQALAGAATCAVVAWLGCRIFGRAEGIVAGLLLAAYGPSLFHEAQIMKTVLTVALSTASAAVLYASGGNRRGRLAAGGALLGLTALAQENINVTLPLLLAWILWRARPASRRHRLACAVALIAGWACVVAPATMRNYAASGEFVLITSGGGEVFYTGNNEFASGKYRVPAFVRPDPFFEHQDFRAEAARRLGRPVESLSRAESDAFWWREGLRFIAQHPRRYLWLLWDKLATYFTAYERPDNYSLENFREFVTILRWPLVGFGLVAPLGLVGLALSARRWPDLLPIHAIMGAYLLSALLFFTQSRYRLPMVPLLGLFAAHAAVTLAAAIRMRDLRRLSWIVPALAALALFVNRDPGHERGFEAQNAGILGEMSLVAGRPDEAVDHFRRALDQLAGYGGDTAGDQHLRVAASCHYGIALARRDGAPVTAPDAIIHLRAALDGPDPDLRRDAAIDLADLLSEQADWDGAAAAWRRAIAERPDDFRLRLRLGEALHKAGHASESAAVVSQALEEIPGAGAMNLAAAHYGLALIHLRDIPDPGKAARHLRETLRLNPDHPRAEWIRSRLAEMGDASP